VIQVYFHSHTSSPPLIFLVQHTRCSTHTYHSRRQKFCCRRTARVCNSLPATIRQITSHGQFRQHLKTHLLRAQKSQRILTVDYPALYKYSYLLTCCTRSGGRRSFVRGVGDIVRACAHHGTDVDSLWNDHPAVTTLCTRRTAHRPRPAGLCPTAGDRRRPWTLPCR